MTSHCKVYKPCFILQWFRKWYHVLSEWTTEGAASSIVAVMSNKLDMAPWLPHQRPLILLKELTTSSSEGGGVSCLFNKCTAIKV